MEKLLNRLTRWARRRDQKDGSQRWVGAQAAERDFWVGYVGSELCISSRDQLVGFRLAEGRVHLTYFGFAWDDWMYSRRPPIISGKLLDVGSALVSVFENCQSVSVVAIDPLLSELARHLPGLCVLGKSNNCEYRCCRIQDVEETDFDIVWCNNVLDHAHDWQDMIHHFARVLKEPGLLFLGTDVRSDSRLLDAAHISAFTADEVLAELEAAGFQILWHSQLSSSAMFRLNVRATRQPSAPSQHGASVLAPGK